MCGIAGIFDSSRPPARAELKAMVDAQNHRGPDDQGLLVDAPMAMGMSRLSIIDLPGGKQPIFNEDGSVAVVMNGEIYNFIELRHWLISRGHLFSTKSDTEVLVHLYEEHGKNMLEKLNGMFAFAIWDRKERSLFIARDRMGVKPLYYARIGPRWIFASELKALLTLPEFDTKLDLEAIADYLRLSYIPREATPYLAASRLLPGHYLFIKGNTFENRAWWHLGEGALDQVGEMEIISRELEAGFDDSVRLRMRSDVPVAAFLSGGLDSSLVTTTAQRLSPSRIHSFTAGFEHSAFDETPYARAVASQAHTDHRELFVKAQDAIEYLPSLLWHMDEPLGDSSIIPNYLISRFASERVKVCLSGLGGDELFGGYSRYIDPGPGRIRRTFRHAQFAARALAPVVSRYHNSWAEELDLAGNPSRSWRSYLHKLQIFDRRGLENIGFPALGQTESIVETLWNRYPGTDHVSRCQFIDQHTYLPDQILALTDRMSMATSLEVRVPFMDYRLVRLAERIPGTWKQDATNFKIILKRALGHRVPAEICTRPKWGFDTPLGRWIGQPEVFKLLQELPHGIAAKQGLFNPRAVRALVQNQETASRFARRVWNLFILDIWLQVHRRLSAPKETLSDLLSVPA